MNQKVFITTSNGTLLAMPTPQAGCLNCGRLSLRKDY